LIYTYYTISSISRAEYKDRGSRFLAFAYPINSVYEFKEKLAALKKEHPKAVHHCFAYRLGTTKNIFRASDDGEPAGSAGRPILGQIDSKQLSNVLVVVVRYFGGTLLGVPGLINAYKTVTALALEQSPVIEKPVLIHYQLEFDYTMMNEVMRTVKQLDCVITMQDLQLFCRLEIGVPLKNREELLRVVKDYPSIEIKLIDN
jgi:uncharacterized YigZ family protein